MSSGLQPFRSAGQGPMASNPVKISRHRSKAVSVTTAPLP